MIPGSPRHIYDPDPVLLKQEKRARRCFKPLVSGRIGSVLARQISKASA
jgi:hypothetical protein